MFGVLEKFGAGEWGLAHREPHFGPYASVTEAQDEIDRYFERWPDDEGSVVFRIFELREVAPSRRPGRRPHALWIRKR